VIELHRKISHVLLLAVISGISDYHFGDNVAFVASSMRTAFGHGLLDPKAKDNSLVHVAACGPGPKGNEVNIPKLDGDNVW
jgi:hypothetical protein